MAPLKEDLERELDELQTHADRLWVKANLGRTELRDWLAEAQKNLARVRGELRHFAREAREPTHEIGDSLGQILEEAGRTLGRILEQV